jgi:hypothetical protein
VIADVNAVVVPPDKSLLVGHDCFR